MSHPASGSGSAGGGDVVGNWIAGHLDMGFAKAQTVLGALYGKDGVPVGTMQVKAGKINKKKGMVKISATATSLVDEKAKKVTAKAAGGKLKKFTAKVIGVVIDWKGWGSATGTNGARWGVMVE